MGLFNDVVKIVEGVVKNIVDAATDAIAHVAGVLSKIGYTIAELVEKINDMIADVVKDVLPEEVSKYVLIVEHFVEFDTKYPPAILKNIENALKTGKLGNLLDAISPAVASAVQVLRDAARGSSRRTPDAVLDLLPESDLKNEIVDSLRWTTLESVDDGASFFYIWSYFKGKRTAICLYDTIVFVEEPNFSDDNILFTYIHEIKHFEQYRRLGIHQFIQDYLQDNAFGGDVNKFEVESDEFACGIMKVAKPLFTPSPAYISSC